MSNILEVVSLTKRYGRAGGVAAVDGIDLKVEEGQLVSIQGPSGSGKSTFLNCIGALDKPTSGNVVIDGNDISKMSDNQLAKLRREKIGFIFQSFNLLPILNAAENVGLAMENTGLSRVEMMERSKKLLKTVGLEDRWNHKPKEMSGGERQRVAIARALANKPDILLADEPTGNLDSKTGKEIVQLLLQLNNNFRTTVIMVTHDPHVAKKFDRQLFFEDGQIKLEKNPGESRKRLMNGLGVNRKLANTLLSAGFTDPSSIKKLKPSEFDDIKGLSIKERNMLIKTVKEL